MVVLESHPRPLRRAAQTIAAGIALLASVVAAWADETTTRPFAGVTYIARTQALPRPVKMHLVLIDLHTPGLRFRVTPHAGALDTQKQTTLDFLQQQKSQIAINGHFFEPWPAPNPDPGTADLVGFAASDGRIYSPFEANPPKPYAIRPNSPALNIDPHNVATIVHRNPHDLTGRSAAEPVTIHNALAGNYLLVTAGSNTVGSSKWDLQPGPLTAIGLAPNQTLVILVVDGRQPGTSEGLSTHEAADLLRTDYHVSDALNLDGGGSSTLCFADPSPRVVNIPVGLNNVPGTLRPVGSNLAIFAPPATPPPP